MVLFEKREKGSFFRASTIGQRTTTTSETMSSSRGSSRTFGPAPNRTMPQNQRYRNTQSRLDTGSNMRKVLQGYEGTSGPNAHKKKMNEFYVRLRPSTLGRLLEPLVEAEESVYQLAAAQDDSRSVVSSVMPEAGTAGSSEGNILILDLRPFEEFEQCHVYGARHYEIAQLSKSTNCFPREVYFYKGPVECDKMVVLYDEDGKSAPAVGNAFVERGIENTYVVSGGFLALCATSPHVLVGHPPSIETLTHLMARAGIKASPGGSSVRGSDAGSVRCSTAGSVRTQNMLGASPSNSPGLRAWK
jgi:centrosomal protein CEP41